jgi:hypothetical protein
VVLTHSETQDFFFGGGGGVQAQLVDKEHVLAGNFPETVIQPCNILPFFYL